MAERRYGRRDALGLLGGVVLLQGAQPPGGQAGPDTLVGELMDPTRAGKLRTRVTEYENDPVVVGVEEKIRCTCGCNLSVYTCRTTDFTCETSPAMHRRVVELMEQQKSAQEVLDAFVAQYGESVLMAPPRAGFNLAGYLVPGILITLVGGALALLIARQTRMRAAGRPSAEPGARPGTSALPSDEQARIKAELEKLGL
jgi:cytochrome c-type biogenesis protein CcmH/NrfF